MNIGTLELLLVVESEFPVVSPFEVYPDCTPEHLELNHHWLVPRFYDPNSQLLILAFQGFVIRSGDKTILVDTCVGDCKPRRRPSFDNQHWNWVDRLAIAGFAPEDIDYVLCTHFHVDHVGWNTRLVDGRWVPTFPKARYLFAKTEWDYWWSDQGRYNRDRTGDYMADSVLPIVDAGLVDFVEMDHRIDDAVSMVPAPGHTPGQFCVSLQSNGNACVLAGDLLHSPLQLTYPDWNTRFCANPEQSRRTRLAFLNHYADHGVLVFPSHFPSPTGIYIERIGSGYQFHFVE